MKIRCLMMFKNEDDLLTPWVLYHGALFGFENLLLFDNGSTSVSTIAQIEALRARGVSIDQSHVEKADFVGKGDLFAAIIRRFDETDPADFYIPLDCDEFVGVRQKEGVSFRSDDIRDTLVPYAGHGGPLAIHIAYQNIPGSADRFRPAFGALTKLFFARNGCRTLEHGFHDGTGRIEGAPLETPLIHVHYHNKPLPLLQRHARQKLEAAMTDIGPAALVSLREARGPGWHLVDYLGLKDEIEYRAGFESGFHLVLPDFARIFRDIGCDLPFSNR